MAPLRQKTVVYGFAQVAAVTCDVSAFLLEDVSAGTFTDKKTDANDSGTGDIAFTGVNEVGDNIYTGSDKIFDQWEMSMSAFRTVGTMALEYWNGSTWATLTATFSNGNINWGSGSPILHFDPPSDWATTTVNGQGPFY